MRDHPPTTVAQRKRVLFGSLMGNATKLAYSKYEPDDNDIESVEQYAARLKNLFEPQTESEQMKLNYEARVQVVGEHPTAYYRAKTAMFEQAYKPAMRDYRDFYNHVIQGMLNQEMRNYLRRHLPRPLDNTEEFGREILEISTIIQQQLKDGEINSNAAVGAEAFTSGYNYHMAANVQSKPRGSINVVDSQKKGQKGACFHCQSPDHYVAQCPRKAAGMPAVQAMPTQAGYGANLSMGNPQYQACRRGHGHGRGGHGHG